MNSLVIYMRDIKRTMKLTSKDEVALAARIRMGDQRAMQILVKANLKFVVKVCQNYRNQGLPMSDLINEGNLGLIRAAKRFDGSQGIRFISYAVWWIRQGILDALARQSRSLNIPAAFSMDIHKIKLATQTLFQQFQRQPSIEELELETGLKREHILQCLNLSEPFASLSFNAKGEDISEFHNSLIDHAQPNPEIVIEEKLRKGFLSRLMMGLDSRERQIIRLYYGLDSGVSKSLGEISNRFGISRERIRQIMKKGMFRLKEIVSLPMNNREINGHA
jgi:RNA polymerase primary sigma factor